MLATYAAVAGKGTAQVFTPLLERQTGLWWCVKDAGSSVWPYRQMQVAGNMPGDFVSLIKTALPEPVGVQWHGDERIGQRQAGGARRQRVCQHRDDGEIVAVFERLNQTIQRKSISKGGAGASKVWGTLEAMPAYLGIQSRQCANRATGLRVPGQLVRTF